MYGIYKRDHNNEPCLVAVCYTEVGARRSCSHYKKCYERENVGTICLVEYRFLDSYWTIKIGYNVLHLMREYQKRKLAKLENRESFSRTLRENQEEKIRSLY